MSKPKNKEGQSSDFNLNPSLLHISALVLNTDPQLLESIHVMTTAIEHKKKVELELFFHLQINTLQIRPPQVCTYRSDDFIRTLESVSCSGDCCVVDVFLYTKPRKKRLQSPT